MKTKLLRKIRKRYDWFFNKDGFPVLIDNFKKIVTIYDFEYMCNYYEFSLEDVKEKVKVSHQEWAIRRLKLDILGNYGFSMNRGNYRLAKRIYKNKLSKTLNNPI
jgi:hypothetical protein